MTVEHSRNLNILDINIQKRFGVSDIKEITIRDDFDIFYFPLHSFVMKGQKYKEFISKKIFSNGNYEHNTIDFCLETEEGEFEEEIEGCSECPKCKYHSISVKNGISKCLGCGYSTENQDEFYSFVEG